MDTPKRTSSGNAVCLSLLWMLAFAATASAQVDRATLNGTVTDSSGAVVQNVKIELVSPATGLHRETATNSQGTYQVPALQIGNYKITMSKDGFKPEVLDNVEFQVGQARTIDARLQVGTRVDIVEVTASEALDRSSAEVGSVIESEQIKEIPLDGRNWSGLMALAPGPSTPAPAISTTSDSMDDRWMTKTITSTVSTPVAYRSRRRKPTRT